MMEARRTTLLERARSFEGRTLGDLANAFRMELPPSLVRKKGAAGELVEFAILQRRAPSSARIDDPEGGVEIKSVPVDERGVPLESTFVASVSWEEIASVSWAQSPVREKLACVLWVPLIVTRSATESRRVGRALLTELDANVDDELARDWEAFSDRLNLEGPGALTAHVGKCLQIRPKAADGSARRRTVDADGVPVLAVPRGAYLRRRFVHKLLLNGEQQ